MKVDEVTKGLESGNRRACRRQPLIDPGLRLAGPAMRVVAAEERLARVAVLSSDLDAGQAPGGALYGGHFRALVVQCVVVEGQIRGYRGVFQRSRIRHRQFKVTKNENNPKR